jgi:hypothetical protein
METQGPLQNEPVLLARERHLRSTTIRPSLSSGRQKESTLDLRHRCRRTHPRTPVFPCAFVFAGVSLFHITHIIVSVLAAPALSDCGPRAVESTPVPTYLPTHVCPKYRRPRRGLLKQRVTTDSRDGHCQSTLDNTKALSRKFA